MEAVVEGLWGLADLHEKKLEIGKSIKCLEAICQSQVSFLPIVEIKTRLRIATLLLKHSHNVNHAKSHLERSQLLLKSIPSCFELKCRTYSLLSQCYNLVGAIPQQKQIINKGLELISTAGNGFAVKLWACNLYSQLANALMIEGDYRSSISALEQGFSCATEIYYPELQVFRAHTHTVPRRLTSISKVRDHLILICCHTTTNTSPPVNRVPLKQYEGLRINRPVKPYNAFFSKVRDHLILICCHTTTNTSPPVNRVPLKQYEGLRINRPVKPYNAFFSKYFLSLNRPQYPPSSVVRDPSMVNKCRVFPWRGPTTSSDSGQFE
ncbi:hypothetical protein GIB67_041975 [Kingdonia uniflora]|uniref:Uncharacterized protein n=1 Tax=Kingdonia uniflora TaxID=39325 RepID=A0A7J7P096_9MAGN|nr:hypothetical protein GIB67_041975 [Kingdonia uniflora]